MRLYYQEPNFSTATTHRGRSATCRYQSKPKALSEYAACYDVEVDGAGSYSTAPEFWLESNSVLFVLNLSSVATGGDWPNLLASSLSVDEVSDLTSDKASDSAAAFAIERVEALELEKQGRAASQIALRFIESRLSQRDVRAVNTFLASLPTAKMSPWALVSVIRSTARARKHLPAWSQAYALCSKELARQNRDPKRLYVGVANDA